MLFGHLKRREFIALLGGSGGVAARGRAQQPVMPVVGLLHSQSADGYKEPLRGFRQDLRKQAISRAKTLRLNTASPRVKSTFCRCWPLT